MCGSGGTTTTQSQYQPPAQVLKNYGQLTAAGQNLISQPQQQYGGSLVEGFNPDQTQAFQTVKNAQGIAQPYINSAAQEIGASTAPVWNGPVTSSGIANYESPYTQDVTGSMEKLYNQENKQADENVAGNATTHGAYGGDREAIAEGITQGQMTLGENQNLAQVEQQGYNTALGEANTEQQTQLGADEANRYLESQAGYGLGNLGNEAQGSALTGASAELQTGADQQQLGQEQLNIPYEEFQAQQAYPYQQLQFLEGLDNSAAAGSGGTTTSASPSPSPLSQVVGGGLAGYGLASAIGGNGISQASNGIPGTLNYSPLTSQAGAINGIDPSLYSSYSPIKTGGRVHRDAGGIAGALNPINQGLMTQYSNLPDDKLREAASRVPPNTPQGAALQRVLQQRQVHPNQQGIAGAASGVTGQAPATPSAPQAPDAPQPMGSMKWGGRTRLATGGVGGGTGGAAHATTFVVGGNGIAVPQVGNSIFAGPPVGGANGYGLAGAFNPLPQIKNTSPNITTAESPAIASGIAHPQDFTMPPPTASSGDSGLDSALGLGAGLALALLKDGGRAHYDDGGEIDDDDDIEGSGDSVSAPAGIAAAPPPSGRPTASAAPPSASSVTKEPHTFTPDTNEILLKTGLAMMAGTSPYAAANIGRGGLAGVQEYDQQKQWDAQQQTRQQSLDRETQRDAAQAQHFKDMDDKPVIDHSGPTTRIVYPSEKNADGSPKILDLGIPTTDYLKAQSDEQHQRTQEGIERGKLGIMQQQAESGKYSTAVPGTGADPNDPTKQVPGAYVTNTKTGDVTFKPGVVLTAKPPAPGTGPSLDPDTIESLATRANMGDHTAASGLGFGSVGAANRAAVADAQVRQQKAKNLTPEQIAENQATFARNQGNMASGPLGNTVTAANTYVSHADVLRDYAKAMDNGDVRLINAAKNRFEAAFGQPAPTTYDALMPIVADEGAKAVIGSAGALGDRDQFQAPFKNANSFGQIASAIDGTQALMAGRINSIRTRYVASGGPNDFDQKWLTPEARDVISRYGYSQDQQAAKSAGAPAGGQPTSATAQPQALPKPPIIQNGWRYDPVTHAPIGPAQ